ncbi:MAG: hypothetical protein ACFFCO_04850 [Promethearchaeota archaeon]
MKTLVVSLLCVLCLAFPAALCAPVDRQYYDYVDLVVTAPPDGYWTGYYEFNGDRHDINGNGSASYRMHAPGDSDETFAWIIEALLTRVSSGSWELTVSLVSDDDEVLRTASTSGTFPATLNWMHTYTPPIETQNIPGFSFAAVITGLIAALITGFAIRRRHRK